MAKVSLCYPSWETTLLNCLSAERSLARRRGHLPGGLRVEERL